MCSIQDEQGFIWLGTKDGLNRFDGNSFKIFRHDEDDTTSIGNDYIRHLHSNKKGELFAGTQRGLYQYHPRTERFTHITSSGTKSIKEIVTDGNGDMWYIAEGTLIRHGNRNKEIKTYQKEIFFWATSMSIDNYGSLWVSTADGFLKKYDAEKDGFVTYPVFQRPVTTSWVEKIYCTAKGNILIGTAAHGLLSFDAKTTGVAKIISQNSDQTGIFVRDILHNKMDEYWLATESGLFIYNASAGSIINLRKDYRNPYSLSDNAVYTLCKDREGGMWAGTFFGGMNYYVEQHAAFQKYFPDYSRNTISGNAVREIIKDKRGNMWVGTEDAGLNKIDPEGNITHFMPTGSKNSLSYYNIHGLLAVNDELWIGTFEHGLDVMNMKTGKVIRHYEAGSKPGDLKSNFVFSIVQTESGKILLGSTAGVFKYQPKTDNFLPISQLNGYTYHILEDSKGVLWSATISDGIKFFDPKSGNSGSFQNDPKNKASISSNMVNSLFEDSKGNLWIATEGGGLCKLSVDRKTIKRYNTKNGLPSNFVFKVLEDDNQQIWVTTSKGLVQFDVVSNVLTVYNSANGLLNDQFNYSSGYKDLSGKLFFGSVKGMISFNPKNFQKNNFVPPVFFTGFQVDNKELLIGGKSPLKESIVYTSKIELPYDESSFSIDFAALSYTAPQMNSYAYKMDGVDQKWMQLEKNRKVYFTNLAPGNYVFKLKAANGNGIWNHKEAILNITILPPWWFSPAVYVIYAFLLLGLVFYLFRNYHLQIKKKNQEKMELLHFAKEKELYEAKMNFFTNIAHEIRTPLTLIKGPLERIIKVAEDVPGIKSSLVIMERNTERLIELTTQLLDYRQTEAGGFVLNFTEENITKLLQETYFSFKSLAEKKKISYTLHLTEEPLIAYADGEALTKIISNLLSNAIKYAEKNVWIKLGMDNEQKSILIEFKNDGDLIPEVLREKIFEPFVRLKKTEKQKGTGIGLALARSLAELQGGKLVLVYDTLFNVFQLTLPVYQDRQTNTDKNTSSPNTILETKT
jgi:signal transduction histidine kinase/ligand-binding sensor domain-containing protein